MDRQKKFYSLGIDTSNYTTSAALMDNAYNIIADERIPLEVPHGLRGLRQSDAVFKHTINLPQIMERLFPKIQNSLIECIAVSVRPRPVEKSYMPVFLSGQALSKSMALALDRQCFEFSHQEGHIRAGCLSEALDEKESFIVFHISGGTTEILLVKSYDFGYEIKIIGGTKDISIGQLIDRIGVKLGLPFPSGKHLDKNALNYQGEKSDFLKKIYVDGLNMNLSGIETQCHRLIDNNVDSLMLTKELFEKISEALVSVILHAVNTSHVKHVLLVGGVTASGFIKKTIKTYFKDEDISLHFCMPQYASDNAVGIAALGMDKLKSFKI